MPGSDSSSENGRKCVGAKHNPTTKTYGYFVRQTRWDERASNVWEEIQSALINHHGEEHIEEDEWTEFDNDALQTRHLDRITFAFPFESLPPELQVEILEWLIENYMDLKCLELVSTAMKHLVARPTAILDATLFRSTYDHAEIMALQAAPGVSSLGYEWSIGPCTIVKGMQLHPVLHCLGQVKAQRDTWTNYCLLQYTEYDSSYCRLYKMPELAENASQPAVSTISVEIWRESWTEELLSAPGAEDAAPPVPFKRTLSNTEGQPINLGQLLKSIFDGLEYAREQYTERGLTPPRHQGFRGWHTQVLDESACLHLLDGVGAI